MIKRIIAVIVALCMIYGSMCIPKVDAAGEPVKVQTMRPIRQVRVKEEESHDKRRFRKNMEPVPAETSGAASGDNPVALGESEEGSVTDAEGDIPEEAVPGEGTAEGPGGGACDAEQTDRGGLEYLGTWTITAYCGCAACCGTCDMETASGRAPVAGHTVACNALPFFTQIMIDGIVYEVEDTGYTEFGDAWIDIYFDTHEEAMAYGVQEHEVYLVYQEGETWEQ